MSGKLVSNPIQINDSTTATNNFVLKADNLGGVKLSRGNDGATTQDILSVNSAGVVTLNQGVAGLISTSDTVGLGYGTGAGGTVTQATSKSTAVTLNKPTGQITMNNAALAASAPVEFTFNNSLLSSSDLLIVTGVWGFSPNYRIDGGGVMAGASRIRITNITGGSLSEAVVINFAIIKGAVA